MSQRKSDLVFHHVGYACASLELEEKFFASLGYVQEGEVFTDPVQRIRGRFLRHGPFRLELLEAAAKDSPVATYLRRRLHMYHQAFETDDLEAALASQEANGGRACAPPAASVAFAGRRIAFVLCSNALLIELIERERPATAAK